ncbi:hypothetical protein V8D89_007985 [Ganoderma adspersum]
MAADLTLISPPWRSPSPPRRTGKEESDLDVASRWTVPRAESLPSLHWRCLAETISMVAISFRLRDEREGTHRVPTVAKVSWQDEHYAAGLIYESTAVRAQVLGLNCSVFQVSSE